MGFYHVETDHRGTILVWNGLSSSWLQYCFCWRCRWGRSLLHQCCSAAVSRMTRGSDTQ